ncbi:MAG TPA: hypothetical protein PLP14_09790, partial [Chitinophagaceae bacterium]|nr:hypothetical protein [Chitinophagaceae bacterium]
MKLIHLLALLTLFVGSTSLIKPDDKILWSIERKLEWRDFKGKRDQKVIDKNHISTAASETGDSSRSFSEAAAYCSHTIEFSARSNNDSIVFEIRNLFNPMASWSQTTSTYILNHEQRHFDLAEVIARQLRKKLYDSISYCSTKRQKEIVYEFLALDNTQQLQYDSITRHSEISAQQIGYDQ